MSFHLRTLPHLLALTLTGALTSGGFAGFAAEPSVPPSAAVAYVMGEDEIRQMLTETLQRDFVKDRGELELRFTRPWSALTVSNELISLKIIELPTAGVSATFIVRFELATATHSLGTWQMPVTAHIWGDVLVAHSPLRRGQLLADADITKERRDLLALRDAVITDAADGAQYELAEGVMVGNPLYERDVKLRTLVRRGQAVEAVIHDGALAVSMKVEVLEDGVLGQQVRVRNLQSKRELRGKVRDEKTVLVSL